MSIVNSKNNNIKQNVRQRRSRGKYLTKQGFQFHANDFSRLEPHNILYFTSHVYLLLHQPSYFERFLQIPTKQWNQYLIPLPLIILISLNQEK